MTLGKISKSCKHKEKSRKTVFVGGKVSQIQKCKCVPVSGNLISARIVQHAFEKGEPSSLSEITE